MVTKKEHRVQTKRAEVRVQVKFGGEVIADSQNAIRLDESGLPPVYYFPRNDVKMERLSRTAHQTNCPFKGDASYFTISSKGRVAENAVWSYENPLAEVADIRELLAFYPNKVDSIATV